MKTNNLESQLSAFPGDQIGSPEYIDLLLAFAWEIRNTETPRSLALCIQAEEHSRSRGYARGLANSLLNQAVCLVRLSKPEAALSRAQEALPRLIDLEDISGEATALTTIGNVQYLSGNYALAMEMYQQSLAGRRKIGDRRGEASTLHNIGNIYDKSGDYPKALEYYYQSLKIKEEIDDRHGLSLSLTNIGTVYQHLGDPQKALEAFQESLQISITFGDRLAQAAGLNNIGYVHEDRGEHTQALDYFQQAYRLAEETGDQVNQAITSTNLGGVYAQLGEHRLAKEYLTRSLALARETGNPLTETMALWEQGRYLLQTGALEPCIETLTRSLEIARRIGSRDWSFKIHASLSEAAEKQGDLAAALQHYREYTRIKSELFNEETDRKTKALIAQIQVEKAQKEAEIYRLKNVELARAYAELAEANQLLQQANAGKTMLLEQLSLQAELLEQQTREDWLTGLYNRRFLDQQLHQEFQRARRFKHPLTVVVADVDDFKEINDRLSHPLGDQVLRQVAGLMRGLCRSTDILARYGGDEFALILPETPAHGGAVLCEKIRSAVEFYRWDGLHPALKVTLSQGLAEKNNDTPDVETLLRKADRRLYEAKNAGRNRVGLGNGELE